MAGRCVYQQNPDAFGIITDFVFSKQETLTPENLKIRSSPGPRATSRWTP